jgi:hypothetical protein
VIITNAKYRGGRKAVGEGFQIFRKMNTNFKRLFLAITFSIIGFNSFALPVYGYPGQGTPNWTIDGLNCNPGFHWCMPTYTAVSNSQADLDLIGFEIEDANKDEITLSFDFVTIEKKFPKMFKNGQLIISYEVDLGIEISNALNKQRKTKSKSTIALKKGTYMCEMNGKACVVKGIPFGNSEDFRKKSNKQKQN